MSFVVIAEGFLDDGTVAVAIDVSIDSRVVIAEGFLDDGTVVLTVDEIVSVIVPFLVGDAGEETDEGSSNDALVLVTLIVFDALLIVRLSDPCPIGAFLILFRMGLIIAKIDLGVVPLSIIISVDNIDVGLKEVLF